MEAVRENPRRRNLAWVGVAIAVPCFLAVLYEFALRILGPGGPLPLWIVVAFCLSLPGLAVYRSRALFRSPFDVLGGRPRTPLPPGPPLFQKMTILGGPPVVTFYVYDTGLGVAGIGEGFIPKKHIHRVEYTRWFPRRGAKVHHDFPEIRRPLFVPFEVGFLVEDFAALPPRAGEFGRTPGRRSKFHRLANALLVLAFVGLLALAHFRG